MMSNNKDKNWTRHRNKKEIYPPHTAKPMSFTYEVGMGSDPGKRKSRNEDSIFAISSASAIENENTSKVNMGRLKKSLSFFTRFRFQWLKPCCTRNRETSQVSFGLFVVADGMGAYANGQNASRGAIQAIVNGILPKIASRNPLEPEIYPNLLAEAIQYANEAVYQQNIALHNRERTDMDVHVSSTVTTAMVIGLTAYIANVGNSRTYLYRDGEGLQKVTNDHSVVADMVGAGILEPDDIYTHRARNQIHRSLGNKQQVKGDIFTIPLQHGDILLLCSPGLWNMVRDPKIEDTLCQTPLDPSQVAETLIQTALESGGKENISVIIVSVLEAQGQTIVPNLQLFAKPNTLHLPNM